MKHSYSEQQENKILKSGTPGSSQQENNDITTVEEVCRISSNQNSEERQTCAISTMKTRLSGLADYYVDDSVKFSLRITASASLASLFILIPNAAQEDDPTFPEALWILITALIVSWQASPDIASVAKKMVQRLIGTILGALLGLALGSLSLFLEQDAHGSTQQSMYLLASLGLGVGSISYLAAKYGYRSHYSATLGCVTFGIVLLAFYDVDAAEDGWRIGVFRMLNICIGGVLGGAVSMMIFPMSTTTLIETKVAKLIQETGNTSLAVLTAASSSSPPPRLIFLARKQKAEDESHQRYMHALAEWQKTRQLFDLLPYDPFFLRLSKQKQKLFWESFRLRLGRVLRIQANLIMLDGLNRNRLHNVQETTLLERIGQRLKTVLCRSDNDEVNDARRALVEEDLPSVRRFLQRETTLQKHPGGSPLYKSKSFDSLHENDTHKYAATVREEEMDSVLLQGHDLFQALNIFDDEHHDDDRDASDTSPTIGLKSFFLSSQSSTFFFQLLEFVIVRSLRLERYCEVTDRRLEQLNAVGSSPSPSFPPTPQETNGPEDDV